MRRPSLRLGRRSHVVVTALILAGCSSGSASSGTNVMHDASVEAEARESGVAMCKAGEALAGANYDIQKSRFSFGSTPVEMKTGLGIAWIGHDGRVGIDSNGYSLGVLNARAPENDLPPLTVSVATLDAYVRQYFEAMGIDPCQVMSAAPSGYESGGTGSIDGGETETTGPVTVALTRGVGGVVVVESLAYAIFDSEYRTTSEAFYWPTIPKEVVASAIAFQAMLADESGRKAYLAKLPADARAGGVVAIHHTQGFYSTDTFEAVVSYDVNLPSDAEDGNLHFDADGRSLTLPP